MAIIIDPSIGITTPAVNEISSTELGYLDGATSLIQSQLNSKEPLITAGTTAQYWRGDKTWQTIDLSGYAPLLSPIFSGTVSLPNTNNYLTSTTTNEKVGHDTMSGTSKTVTDAFVTANTFITIIPLSDPSGVLSVNSNSGNFVITSTKSETLTFKWVGVK